MLALSKMGIKAGTQAAISTGEFEPCPRTVAISFKKKIKNATNTPRKTLVPIPFLPRGLTEKDAPINTIPIKRKGEANKLCQ